MKQFLRNTALCCSLIAGLSVLPVQAGPLVQMQTSAGNLEIELFQDQAPKTVANFLQYVEEGFYNGSIFHRVIPGFMIQGGGFTEDMQKKQTRAPIENESNNGLSNLAGTLAMARTNDPHSATAQFFINSVDNPRLDARGSQHGYAVFGRIVKGMDVVSDISDTPTTVRASHRDVPTTPIVILGIKPLPTETETETPRQQDTGAQ
ncbi:peptidylprolyl isomerase [Marinobacterium aestuarii]|uniref:Peptidyl-prolyl cis-trans isomerase n=1 Tax=Marinobacterium aestuarii TaxID=1821621 RepID=A0A1A9F0V7_9GAMM|nr:peptidylprolyl isomerase [Marinobacterium aestuarii]ANG63722.1 peptidylprolyl isomerase [Marinobacterium aestuarii]